MELLSEHFKKEHMLSGIDARVKVMVAFALLIMILSYKGFTLPLCVTLLCLFLFMKMKIPSRVFILRFSEPLFIAFVVLILKFLFSGKNEMFSFTISGIRIAGHTDGIVEGLLIACRIIGAVSVVAALGFSTPLIELMAGLSWLKVPKGFIEILMFAYRYIFVLLEDATVIYSAQKNRLGYSSIRRGLSSFGTLAGTLTIKAFEHSENITVAMVQRGYDGNIPMLKHKPFKPSEIIASVLFIAATAFIWTIV